MEFEWDLTKDLQNIRKQGVSFTEAVESFLDPHGFHLADRTHSKSEARLYWVGRIATGRIVTTRLTRRGKIIRTMGAAEWGTFRRLYHETTKSSSSQD